MKPSGPAARAALFTLLLFLLSACGGGGGGGTEPPPTGEADPTEEPGAGPGEGDATGGNTGGGAGGGTGGDSGGGDTDAPPATPPRFTARPLPVEQMPYDPDLSIDLEGGRHLFEFFVWSPGASYVLRTPEATAAFWPEEINANGWVRGYKRHIDECDHFDQAHGVVWRGDGTVAFNGIGSASAVTDINDQNVAVGVYEPATPCQQDDAYFSYSRFFRLDPSGLTDLGDLGVIGPMRSLHINNHGDMAFATDNGAYVRSADGSQQQIPLMQIEEYTDAGVVAGCVEAGTTGTPATWSGATGLVTYEGHSGCLADMNAAGDAVGVIDQSPTLLHDGRFYPLHELVGADWQWGEIRRAGGIDDRGRILLDTTSGPVLLEPDSTQAPRYSVLDLDDEYTDVVSFWPEREAEGLNDRGWIYGRADGLPWVLRPEGEPRDMRYSRTMYASPDALNDSGWLAGRVEDHDISEYVAAIWNDGGQQVATAANPSWSRDSRALDINNHAVAVGIYLGSGFGPDGSFQPRNGYFRWDSASGFTELGMLGAEGRPRRVYINDSGAIAYSSEPAADTSTTYLRQPDGSTRSYPGLSLSALSENGSLAGCVTGTQGELTPALGLPDGRIVYLDAAQRPGCTTAVNANGDAVGYLSVPDGRLYFAYLGGQLYNLRNLLPADWPDEIAAVQDINDRGQILIRRIRGDSRYGRPALLNPAP